MHQVSEFYDCHPLSAWCPFELSFLAPKLVENLGRYCFFSPWLVLELSWHQCGTTRIHFHLLICNFHNQWDWPNYWANVLGWFVCDSCTRRDMEIKFSFYLLVFKCPTTTTTYDATVFLEFGGIPGFSILEVKEVCHSVVKCHFPNCDVSSWCLFWLMLLLQHGVCVENVSNITTHIPKWPTWDVFPIPVSHTWIHSESNTNEYKTSSFTSGFCKYFFLTCIVSGCFLCSLH